MMKDRPVILVVDDQPQNLELLEAHLLPQGYVILKAANGEEALEILSGNQIDLVLLDVMMPGMNGFEVLEKLRADKRTRLIPVVMLTVLNETEDRVKALEAGCDDFISKPFDRHELLARVTSLLKIKSLHDEVAEAREYAEKAQSEAEAATRAKSDFLANMSHELRTPLNSIIGFSEVLEDELLGPLNTSQREDVQYILKAGRHLLSLINDILDLSKVESGKMELETDRVSLKQFFETVLSMHREKALHHGIALDLQIEPLTDMVINADERKLKQILFNLLSNAVKFTPDGGSVRVVVRMISDAGAIRSVAREKEGRVTASPLPSDNFIEISVEDTGIGIKPEDIPKLFKEFSQLDSVYDKKYEGTGLGLAITRKLVELHGGRIQVASTFGSGSRFSFVIPVMQTRGKNE